MTSRLPVGVGATVDGPIDGPHNPVDAVRFRDVLARFPTGVTIVTVRDSAGVPYGLTATAFCPVSLDPPLVCVCVARSARSYPVFAYRDEFAVSFLRTGHADLALRFSRSRDDKFAQGRFRYVGDKLVILEDALAVLRCTVDRRFEVGDHVMLVGEVRDAELATGEPLVFFNRAFRQLADPSC